MCTGFASALIGRCVDTQFQSVLLRESGVLEAVWFADCIERCEPLVLKRQKKSIADSL